MRSVAAGSTSTPSSPCADTGTLGRLRFRLASVLAATLVVGLLPAAALAADPSAVDDTFTVGVDASATALDVLANDSDPDSGDTVSITGVTDPAHGAAAISSGEIDYTPDAAFHGTDSFDYTVEYSTSGTSTATVSVVVNDPPIAVDDPGPACFTPNGFGGGFPVREDYVGPAAPTDYLVNFGSCSVLGNDTDPNGDPLTWEIVSQPAHGHVIKIAEDFIGYRPDHDYSTEPGWLPGHTWSFDTLTYRAFDGQSYSQPATMKFWVAPINDPPTFTPGGTVTVAEGSGHYSGQWATNINPGPPNESDQTVSFELVGETGTSSGPGPLLATLPAISSSGVLSFTVTPDVYGVAHVTIRAHDDGGLEDWDVPSQPVPPKDTSADVTFDIVVTKTPDNSGPDTTKPIEAPPLERYLGQTIGTTTKAKINWLATDPGSGIAKYSVQVSTNGSGYATVALPSALSTSTTWTLTDGRTYRFRVKATDKEGNVGNWVYGPLFKPARFQDSASTVHYTGAWSKSTTSSASGGSTHATGTPGRKVMITLTAWDVGLIVTRTSSSGMAEVWIDGVLASTINLRSSSTKYRQLLWKQHFATLASHVIELRAIGGGRVDFDAFVALR